MLSTKQEITVRAIIAADRFIQLHPGHRDIAYAYYLKAISYYVQIVDIGRDQKTTELALKALDDVIRRFPDSKYARDAKLKLDFTRDHLAGKEMEIGRYYLKRGQYLAAMNRFKRVIDNYQTTTHVPEALERLVECDLALGLNEEATSECRGARPQLPGQRVVCRCVFPRHFRHPRFAGQRLVRPEFRKRLLTRFGGAICPDNMKNC